MVPPMAPQIAPKILISVDDCAYTPGQRSSFGLWNGLADLTDYLSYDCLLKFVLHNSAALLDAEIGMLPKSTLMRRVAQDACVLAPKPTALPDLAACEADLIIVTGYFANQGDLELAFEHLAHFNGKVIIFGLGLTAHNGTIESFKRGAATLRAHNCDFGTWYCQDEYTCNLVQACGFPAQLVGPLPFMLPARSYFKCADELVVSEVRGAALNTLQAQLREQQAQLLKHGLMLNYGLRHKVRLLHYPPTQAELSSALIFEAQRIFSHYLTRAAQVITASHFALYLCLALGIPVRYVPDAITSTKEQCALFTQIAAVAKGYKSDEYGMVSNNNPHILSSQASAAANAADPSAHDAHSNFIQYDCGALGQWQRTLLLGLVLGQHELSAKAASELEHCWSALTEETK